MASRWAWVIRGGNTPPVVLCISSSAEPSGVPAPTTTCDRRREGSRVIMMIYMAEATMLFFCMAVLFCCFSCFQ